MAGRRPNILLAFGFSIIALGAFAIWESYYKSPMLDTSFFKNPRFTAASLGIMLLFFAMFGSIFLLTQYLQFVMGFSALKAGVALLPLALTMLIVAPSSARIVERVGTKLVVGSGLGDHRHRARAVRHACRPRTSRTGATSRGAWSSWRPAWA